MLDEALGEEVMEKAVIVVAQCLRRLGQCYPDLKPLRC